MRAIDLHHLGREKVICCWQAGPVLVDPGPESCVQTLLAALGDERPEAILLTHIHFDHAGATGALVQRWPDVPVYVHERGARHLADPERLVASATRLYGEENFARLWGAVIPVPEANLRVLSGGERGVEGAFRVDYTPGHASHHVSFLHEDAGWAFVGDVAGVRIPPAELVLAPTPPPDIDLGLWRASLDQIEAWRPTAIAPTHFGRYENVAEHIAQLRERLGEWERLAAGGDEAEFIRVLGERARIDGDPAAAVAYQQAMPADQSYAGMRRYLEKA
jgi:glyoxylase-like metal-dependent hydrolase (beta-lactamase superfamily II)